MGGRYSPHPKQLRVHRSKKRWIVVSAGVRGGKSLCGAYEFCRRIFNDLRTKPKKRRLYWIVGPTFKLTEYVWEYVCEFIPRELVVKKIANAQARELHLVDGIEIECHGSDRPERLVGASVSGLIADEACRIKSQTWKGSLRGRLTDNEGWAIFTSSPLGGRNNWIFQEFVAKAGTSPDIGSFSWTTSDNPHIARSEIEAARAELAPEWFAREYEASFDSFGGSIYSEFSDAHIVTEQELRFRLGWGQRPIKDAFRRIVCGVDFGLTAAGAMIVVGHLNDSRVVFLEESYAPGRHITHGSVSWVSEAKRLREKWGIEMFYCDPADPSKIMDLRIAGLPVQGASNNVHKGIRRVAESLHVVDGKPQSFMLSDCKHLIRELRNYQWRPTKDQSGFYEEPADGQSDHACDAARYGVVGLRPFVEAERKQDHGHSFVPVG
jgi:hypothetical protein